MSRMLAPRSALLFQLAFPMVFPLAVAMLPVFRIHVVPWSRAVSVRFPAFRLFLTLPPCRLRTSVVAAVLLEVGLPLQIPA